MPQRTLSIDSALRELKTLHMMSQTPHPPEDANNRAFQLLEREKAFLKALIKELSDPLCPKPDKDKYAEIAKRV